MSNELKHTPGPWVACGNGECPCGMIWTKDGVQVATVNGPRQLGDGCNGPDYVPTEDAQKANAKLIASAPEMLATISQQAARIEELERSWDEAGKYVIELETEVERLRAELAETKAQSDTASHNARHYAEMTSKMEAELAAQRVPQYSHRNGETDAPTVDGWYWFDGVDHEGYEVERVFYVYQYDGMWLVDDESLFENDGRWWGPVTPPWDAPSTSSGSESK